jgi:hypothetical protein
MLQRLRRDKRGVSVVTYALVLPLFVVAVFGIMEIWRVMSIRQSLHLGTYSAARSLSVNGRQWLPASAGRWEALASEQARYLVRQELEVNALLPANYSLQVWVEIEPAARIDLSRLGWFFTLRSQCTLPGFLRLAPINIGTLTLNDRQISYIEGITGDWVPPEEGAPY